MNEKNLERKNLHDGFEDDLDPLESLDLKKINNFSELTKAMSKTAFGGRSLGEAVDVLEAMTKDKDCFIVLTLSGAMTAAKMGLIICDLIDHGMVNAVVSTGALVTHGFVEAQGMTHFKYKFGEMDDNDLYDKGYDRIYDIIELEKNLDDTELTIKKILTNLNMNGVYSSRKICEELGKYLKDNVQGRGILKSAYDKKVPVYIPSFTDSELGLDFALFNRRQKMFKKPTLKFDVFLDLEDFTKLISKQKSIGIFTVGGGVPRNWAQQVAPYLEIIQKRDANLCNECDGVGCKECEWKGSKKDLKLVRYKYGVRICPEPAFWGGLSGCTYSEGVSWGKFTPKEEGGQWAEVLCDATIALPIVVKAVMERMGIK